MALSESTSTALPQVIFPVNAEENAEMLTFRAQGHHGFIIGAITNYEVFKKMWRIAVLGEAHSFSRKYGTSSCVMLHNLSSLNKLL